MTAATLRRPVGILLAPLRWLERARGWRRRLLIVVYLIVGGVLGVLTWRATSLNYLPDVGDPFDVEAFIASTRVPESEDAFVLYRKAGEAVSDLDATRSWNVMTTAAWAGWSGTSPEVRDWVSSRRDVLALWRKGTERPGGVPESLETLRWSDGADLSARLHCLGLAAMLEGARLESEGDRVGALGWYLATLRSCRHLATRSRVSWRYIATYLDAAAFERMIRWADDPGTDAALLREALAAIQDLDAHAPPLSDTLKVEYLALIRTVGDPARMARQTDLDLIYSHELMGRWLDAY